MGKINKSADEFVQGLQYRENAICIGRVNMSPACVVALFGTY